MELNKSVLFHEDFCPTKPSIFDALRERLVVIRWEPKTVALVESDENPIQADQWES